MYVFAKSTASQQTLATYVVTSPLPHSPLRPAISSTAAPRTASLESGIPAPSPSTVPSGQVHLNPNAEDFLPSFGNTSSKQSERAKSKKAVDANKDPKDVEIDFLKRELNTVKVHLLEYKSKLKDLKQKNKVSEDTVIFFENIQQKDMVRPPPAKLADAILKQSLLILLKLFGGKNDVT